MSDYTTERERLRVLYNDAVARDDTAKMRDYGDQLMRLIFTHIMLEDEYDARQRGEQRPEYEG